jgi:hypothetical protein
LRRHARSPAFEDYLQAGRLLKYCVGRGMDLSPIGPNFGNACDQIDRAEVLLAQYHDRLHQGLQSPEPTWPDTDGPQILALARQDPDSQLVSFVLDATTANIALFAIAAEADEREAHVREVERYGASLPEGSYGKRNRQAIAARETRVATRLRAIDHAYRVAIERNNGSWPPEPLTGVHPAEPEADKEMELE